MLSCECQVNQMMVRWYWFSEWLGGIRQHNTSWTLAMRHSMGSPGHRYFLEFELKIFDGLVQERRNSSVLAMELRLSCISPFILCYQKGINLNLVIKEQSPKASKPILLIFDPAIGNNCESWTVLTVYGVTEFQKFQPHHLLGCVQDCMNSVANTLELLQFLH